ncbi:S8 family peptidase [Phytomonospora endophytica]|uniref:Subtilisin family serine protease n=1 Tax=Phytomonospora endophytica TaxID=714109 RepID=A0A841FCX9_9ACTN|nr:S8 family peptidase [Phytomonospora endophytica]MBB6035141.1 subtilisin family serine protease [Phytomonospora endophytica]
MQAYEGYLAQAQESVLTKVPGADKIYSYDTTFNGFAVKLTATEATAMAKTNGVTNMWKNELHAPDTSSTPDFLGLTGANGVWETQYGGDENAGSGVVVGIVDSGYWPENPSFAPLPEPRPEGEDEAVYGGARGFTGTCDQGSDEDPTANVECNNKVIGARYFGEGIKASSTPPVEGEFDSPRDFGGHGSHTASTAAGNHGVDASIDGTPVGKISGMAPAARLSIYKACWETIDPDACATTVDLVAAIEQATTDGVDVINYSISGSSTYVVDPVEIAFLNAAAAGVFVAASAGNSGPGASTVAHNSPWLTTVAASTHDRDFQAAALLGDGQKLTGAGRGAALPSTDVVLAKDIPAAGASASDANLCVIGALDPAKAAGKIVACQRGVNARTDKSIAVKQAGGVGMIQFNVPGGAADIAADFQVVPSVHVNAATGTKLLNYLKSTKTPTASLEAGKQVSKRAPEMAGFSSAGPANAGGGDLLKPDITAPGVDVIAAVAPPGNNGNNYSSYQGTSMSSPHIAGLAALIIGKHPDWSPMAVKSAMMTTASQTDNTGKPIQRGGHNATPLDFGAGHVAIAKAFDPGLVYDSNPVEWVQYACGLGQWQLLQGGAEMCAEPDPESNSGGVGSIDPSDLNYASISVGDLAGKQTVTRTVTNVGTKTETYFATIEAPAGTKVSVDKQSITLRPGASATFKVTITRTTAALEQYSFGSLTWRSLKGKTVRSPIAVRSVALSAPAEATGTGTDGSVKLSVKPGFSGTLKSVATALAPDQAATLPLKTGGEGFDPANPATSDRVGKVELSVPDDAVFARFSTANADFAQYGEGTDVDLFVFQKVGDELVYLGNSAAGGSDESVTLPAGADYVLFVDLYAAPVASLDVPVHTWVVGGEGADLTVNPASAKVTTGTAVDVTASWTGLQADGNYLGAVFYLDGANEQVGYTVLNVTS